MPESDSAPACFALPYQLTAVEEFSAPKGIAYVNRFSSISAMPEFSRWNHEELRVAYYSIEKTNRPLLNSGFIKEESRSTHSCDSEIKVDEVVDRMQPLIVDIQESKVDPVPDGLSIGTSGGSASGVNERHSEQLVIPQSIKTAVDKFWLYLSSPSVVIGSELRRLPPEIVWVGLSDVSRHHMKLLKELTLNCELTNWIVPMTDHFAKLKERLRFSTCIGHDAAKHVDDFIQHVGRLESALWLLERLNDRMELGFTADEISCITMLRFSSKLSDVDSLESEADLYASKSFMNVVNSCSHHQFRETVLKLVCLPTPTIHMSSDALTEPSPDNVISSITTASEFWVAVSEVCSSLKKKEKVREHTLILTAPMNVIWQALISSSSNNIADMSILTRSLPCKEWASCFAANLFALKKTAREKIHINDSRKRTSKAFFSAVDRLESAVLLVERLHQKTDHFNLALSKSETNSLKALSIRQPLDSDEMQNLSKRVEEKVKELFNKCIAFFSDKELKEVLERIFGGPGNARLVKIERSAYFRLRLPENPEEVEDFPEPQNDGTVGASDMTSSVKSAFDCDSVVNLNQEQELSQPVLETSEEVELDCSPQKKSDLRFGPDSELLISGLYTTVLGGVWESVLQPVFASLKAIAEGFWLGAVCKPLMHESLIVPVYEAKVLMIKIWNIGSQKDLDGIIPRIVAAQKTYSIERRSRSSFRSDKRDGIVFPTAFRDDGGDAKHVTKTSNEKLDEVDALLMHDMAVTSKFVPLSKVFLNWLICTKNEAAEFPFMLSESEDVIVRHPKSVLLCGRSGTGKTSCSIFRLLSMYYVYHCRAVTPLFSSPSSVGEIKMTNHLHQIFLTASPDFCMRVRSYFKRLLTSLTREKDKADIDGSETVSTRSEAFLKTVAAYKRGKNTASESKQMQMAFEALENGGSHGIVETETEEMFEEGMESRLLGAVPESLLDLEDKHFPLFLTYRKFSSMLRCALGLEKASDDILTSLDDPEPFEVDYPMFLYNYWPHIDSKLTHNMDPSLVYNEIIGVIKGSYSAAKSQKGCLSREEYVALSERSFGTFRGQRNNLYDLYLAYEKVKGEDLDVIDKANEVNRVLSERPYRGPPIHEIFVDEVQDLTMAQLLPLVGMCASPGSGLMFAGDTAQTISRGSSFRFQDLSSMIHTVLELKHGKEFAVKTRPDQFQLTRNYRSHDGILRLAASVLDLIQNFFPNSIDSLERDIGAVDGPLPVCFLGKDQDLLGMFGLSGNQERSVGDSLNSSVQIEFGAEQVILVRNNDDYDRLRSMLGDTALILTVEQSKGMEFEDVLMYCPFGSSPAGSGWRVFFSQIEGNTEPYPTFIPEKHNILSVELKVLYTAITRARKRV
ncbi:hypothetical protein HDU83_005372 [Entophlyctis luteolus]|nr:hypothetical protein HDU83_005372 [Entophlyctis luteolus]